MSALKKKAYSIGETEPWRLGKDSAHRLVMAICLYNAKVIASSVERIGSRDYASIRFLLDPTEAGEFAAVLEWPVDPGLEAGGARPEN